MIRNNVNKIEKTVIFLFNKFIRIFEFKGFEHHYFFLNRAINDFHEFQVFINDKKKNSYIDY